MPPTFDASGQPCRAPSRGEAAREWVQAVMPLLAVGMLLLGLWVISTSSQVQTFTPISPSPSALESSVMPSPATVIPSPVMVVFPPEMAMVTHTPGPQEAPTMPPCEVGYVTYGQACRWPLAPTPTPPPLICDTPIPGGTCQWRGDSPYP